VQLKWLPKLHERASHYTHRLAAAIQRLRFKMTSPASQRIQSNTLIRTAFLVEAIFNVIGATAMLLYPSWLLNLVTPTSILGTSSVDPTAVTLLQWLATLVIGLTPQLLLTLPNTPRTIASRPVVYITLLSGEACLVLVILWQALAKGEAESGMTMKALMICAGQLAILVPWRVYVLFVRPEWFGNMVIADKQK